MLRLLTTREDLDTLLDREDLVLVPTMGALHEGHLSLIRLAREHGSKVIVSIFVNPLQFAEGEDFDQYPRKLAEDMDLIEDLADYLWAPTCQDIYPLEVESKLEMIHANSEIADKLCGLSRKGHFDGVCTVVTRLFDFVKSSKAVFGEKDFQQLMVIEDMVKRYKLPVEIIRGPMIREGCGLAMSSRNQYLSDKERLIAANIYKYLQAISAGDLTIEHAREIMISLGIELEYLEKHWGRLFFAGKVGQTRLIDNINTGS